jgi:hypothetical protein
VQKRTFEVRWKKYRPVREFCWESLKEGDHLRDLGVDGRIILKEMAKVACDDMEWIYLPPDWDQWWALLNTVMNLWVP